MFSRTVSILLSVTERNLRDTNDFHDEYLFIEVIRSDSAEKDEILNIEQEKQAILRKLVTKDLHTQI